MTMSAGGVPHAKGPVVAGDAGVTFDFPASGPAEEAARGAVVRAANHLLARQDAGGWWKGRFTTDVGYDAHDLFLRHLLGVLDERLAKASARWIRSQQSADGSWPLVFEGEGHLGTTVQAYVALRLAGDGPDEEHMLRCAAWVRERGGAAAAQLTARVWLALLGWWSWDDLPEVPPEIIALPKWAPLNIYSFSSVMRVALVAISVISTHRPVRPAPFAIDELFAPPGSSAGAPAPDNGREKLFRRLNATVRVCSKGIPRPVREAAANACVRWLLERQEEDGSWGACTPMTTWVVLALHLHGYPSDHPVLKAAWGFLEDCGAWPEDGVRALHTVHSPVWDTCLSATALLDAGLAPGHPALVEAADWLLTRQADRPGDWAARRPRLSPGGWAFQFHNRTYPDNDDTSEVALALHRVNHPDPTRVDDALARAVRWCLGMQSRDGGWAAFDVDNTSTLPAKLPFFDFGEFCTDPPTADITAHVVEMLAALGRAHDPRTRRAVRWLLGQQEANGAWYGRWGVNYVYGTGSVLPALVAAGVPRGHAAVRRAVAWLTSVQNADGGWGESWESYADPARAGRGPSTPSQTAWALLGLLAAGERDSTVVRDGVRWLTERQTEDGTWEEPQYTGTLVPRAVAAHYGYYGHVFPLMALGRYVRRTGDVSVGRQRNEATEPDR
ncbi:MULTISPECIES: squalene--hopene cyclase [Streptomyces]|uniref:squalene--hopene cyclase n=1 Tax=Streptomyces TaxID=1883 RepID=UPI0016755407|nr:MULTISPECIES: squalene--hopene cyclase [Streptomyces]MBK3525559.1 squalene--hopene cyclase [Streptomyces sp. MBT70]GGR76138.1 squalene-hopene cyclase [Streptomyces eurythermus]